MAGGQREEAGGLRGAEVGMREGALTCIGAQAGGGDKPAPHSSFTEGATHPGQSSHSGSSRVRLRGRPCRVFSGSNHPTRGPQRAPVGPELKEGLSTQSR